MIAMAYDDDSTFLDRHALVIMVTLLVLLAGGVLAHLYTVLFAQIAGGL